ncbi:MAG: ATP synthase F1 subunit delta [Balneolales bacterium]
MIVTKVAKRYASALFQQAQTEKALDAVSTDMQEIRSSISNSKELLRFLKSQVISREIKRNILHNVFDKGFHAVTQKFIELILKKRREDQLAGIADAFEVLYKKEIGIIDVEVLAIKRPDAQQIDHLKKALKKKTGSNVNLIFTDDISLKGGMAIRIEDTIIDGSVKHKLKQLEAKFRQAGI